MRGGAGVHPNIPTHCFCSDGFGKIYSAIITDMKLYFVNINNFIFFFNISCFFNFCFFCVFFLNIVFIHFYLLAFI